MASTRPRRRPFKFVRRGLLWASGPLARKRHGYVFIWRRVVAHRLDDRSRRRARPSPLDLLTLDDLPARSAGATYRELEPMAEDATPPAGWTAPQRCLDDGDADVSGPLRRAAGRGQGVVEIPGGVAFGSNGTYGPDPHGVLTDANALWPGDERFMLAPAQRGLAAGLEDLPGVTISTMAHNDNYCHWLLQGLPRLDLLRRGFGLEADRIMVRAGPRPTIEALTILGVPPERLLLTTQASPAYRCETLRAATSPLFRDLGLDWVVEFLHELYLPDPPAATGRRIYLQRGVANRSVLNEDAALELLEPAGFEAVSMDGRTVREQAALFASADVVVSTHGAALANLAFCRPGTTVFELAGSNTARTGFARLCWRRGMGHEFVVGTEPAPPGRWWTWQIDADTAIDVPGLRRALERRDLL